jgi:hypothetical protein
MAYDEALAQRLRQELAGRAELSEKKMFGGLAFLLRGNMCVGVNGADLIARVDPDRYEELVARPGARPFAMGGRTMAGWLVVDGGRVADPPALAAWVQEADAFVQALPSKR